MANFNILVTLILVAFYLFMTESLYAEGELSVKLGKYKLSKTTKTNFDSAPVTRITEECITNPDLDPESILPSKENCKIQNMKTAQNETSFDFVCSETGKKSTLKGYAEYSTKGNMISSQIKLEGTYQGKELIVESSGTGEWIGDCLQEPEFSE